MFSGLFIAPAPWHNWDLDPVVALGWAEAAGLTQAPNLLSLGAWLWPFHLPEMLCPMVSYQYFLFTILILVQKEQRLNALARISRHSWRKEVIGDIREGTLSAFHYTVCIYEMQIKGNLNEINCMNVIYMEKTSEGALILFCRRNHKGETNHKCKNSKLSVTMILFRDMEELKWRETLQIISEQKNI